MFFNFSKLEFILSIHYVSSINRHFSGYIHSDKSEVPVSTYSLGVRISAHSALFCDVCSEKVIDISLPQFSQLPNEDIKKYILSGIYSENTLLRNMLLLRYYRCTKD